MIIISFSAMLKVMLTTLSLGKKWNIPCHPALDLGAKCLRKMCEHLPRELCRCQRWVECISKTLCIDKKNKTVVLWREFKVRLHYKCGQKGESCLNLYVNFFFIDSGWHIWRNCSSINAIHQPRPRRILGPCVCRQWRYSSEIFIFI